MLPRQKSRQHRFGFIALAVAPMAAFIARGREKGREGRKMAEGLVVAIIFVTFAVEL